MLAEPRNPLIIPSPGSNFQAKPDSTHKKIGYLLAYLLADGSPRSTPYWQNTSGGEEVRRSETPREESIDSLAWTVGALIYFTGASIQDGPATPRKRRKSQKHLTPSCRPHLARGDIAQLVERSSCNWVVAITGWMSNCPGGNDSILYLNRWLTFSK